MTRSISRYLHSVPGTAIYLCTLAVTTLTISLANSRLADHLLRQQSTNLTNLLHKPLGVLVSSAFWLQGGSLLGLVLGFALVLAPAERWLGTGRWLAVFVAGHVGATLVTAAGIWLVTHGGQTNTALVNDIDVGVSYGFYAVAAVLVYRLPRRWRLPVALLLLGRLAFTAWGGDFTDIGHLCAAAIGFACYPIARGRLVRREPAAEPEHVAPPQTFATPRPPFPAAPSGATRRAHRASPGTWRTSCRSRPSSVPAWPGWRS
jgi:hypothetical protein